MMILQEVINKIDKDKCMNEMQIYANQPPKP